MKAKKENKSYRISTEQEKQRYLKDGFDIYDDDGKLLEYSPLKKIAYGEYAKLQAENASLKAENEALRTRVAELESEEAEKDVVKKTTAKKAGE